MVRSVSVYFFVLFKCTLRCYFKNVMMFDFSFILVPSIPKTSEDAIVAHSPTLDMGILADHFDFSAYHQYSPIQRSMSNVVAPFNQHDKSWTDFIEFDFPEYSAASNEFTSWPKSTDENIFDSQPENLTDLFDDFFDSL